MRGVDEVTNKIVELYQITILKDKPQDLPSQ
jgi:hypothetical protein